MSRIVNCVKLKREAEGLDFPPYPGLQQQMERFLFEDGTVEAQGYVPPSA
ncbi:oxidative damage protection protein [Bordetella pertussis]|nr:oxidative damage protection protein [Bordetella pertussis]